MDEKEYIERNAVIEEIESLSVTVTGLRAGKNLLTRYAKHYKDSVVKVLSDVPAADVVPRTEVAREIFEELFRYIYKGADIYCIAQEHLLSVKKKYTEGEDVPAADVVEVVHAHWIDRDGKTWCSNCDASNKQYKSPYCPHCGARMDGERKEQK